MRFPGALVDGFGNGGSRRARIPQREFFAKPGSMTIFSFVRFLAENAIVKSAVPCGIWRALRSGLEMLQSQCDPHFNPSAACT